MDYDQATLQSWIEKIRNEGRELTTWEEEFVESVASQLERRGSLSQAQTNTLERIYAEKTP